MTSSSEKDALDGRKRDRKGSTVWTEEDEGESYLENIQLELELQTKSHPVGLCQ